MNAFMNKNAKIIMPVLFAAVLAVSGCLVIKFGDTGANQASKITDARLSALEREVLKELNLARSRSGEYADRIESLLKYYQGNVFSYPGMINIRTKEGIPAVQEAVRYLRKVGAMEPFKSSEGISKAARDHVRDQGPAGTTGHYGSDRSSPFDRMKRYGQFLVTAGENIGYGPSRGDFVVMGLIIDDGVPGRGHRKNIFNKNFKVVGIACGPHRRYGTMCVIDFAGGFVEK